jgi:hypothetical protein
MGGAVQPARGTGSAGAAETQSLSGLPRIAAGDSIGTADEDADGASAGAATYGRDLLALVTQANQHGRTPLHVMAMTDNYATVDMLIRELVGVGVPPADVAAALTLRDALGSTPLTTAFDYGHADTLAVLRGALAAAGADADAGIRGRALPTAPAGSYAAQIHALRLGKRAAERRAAAGLFGPQPVLQATAALPPAALALTPAMERGESHDSLAELSGSTSAASHPLARPILRPQAGDAAMLADGVVAHVSATDNGGWLPPRYISPLARAAVERAAATPERCPVDIVVHNISAADFFFDYYLRRRPVIVRGAADKWDVRELWRLESLLGRHGDTAFEVSEIPYGNMAGAYAKSLTMREYVYGLLHCGEEHLHPTGQAAAAADGDEGRQRARTAAAAGSKRRGRAAAGSAEDVASVLTPELCSLFVAAPPPANKTAGGLGAAAGARTGVDRGRPLAAQLYVFERLRMDLAPLKRLIAETTVPDFIKFKLDRLKLDARASEGGGGGPASGGASTLPDGETAASSKTAPAKPSVAPNWYESQRLDGPGSAELLGPQFYIGAAGSGAPIHYHTDAQNVLLYGRKRWYLMHPSDTEFQTVPISAYVTAVQPGLPSQKQPFECTQYAGDVAYVPRAWGHGVLSMETTVGYAREFRSFFSETY